MNSKITQTSKQRGSVPQVSGIQSMTQTDAGGKTDTYRKYRKRGLADLDASGAGAKKMMGRAGATAPDFQGANATTKFQRQTLMGE